MGARKFVHSAVKRIDETSVTLANGDVLTADYVVVSIGGFYKATDLWKPGSETVTTKEKRIELFRSEREKIASSDVKSIVILGAGLTGVEVAGEVKTAFPDKDVTMVGILMVTASDSMRTQVRAALEKIGVKIAEGKVKETAGPFDGKVTTTKGETFDADIVLKCAGFSFNSGDLVGENLKGNVTDRGQLNCRPTLQLKGCDNVLACGVIVAIPEGFYGDIKAGKQSEDQGKIVAKNIMCLATEEKLVTYNWSAKPITYPLMTVLSPNIGIADMGMPFFMKQIQNFICRKVKCEDFYMSIMGKSYGKGNTWG